MRIVALTPKRWIMVLLAVAALASAAGLIAWHLISEPKIVHLDVATDVSDDRKLVGIAHNVFIGQVTKKVGRTWDVGYRETQFRVEVLESLKGPSPSLR